MSDCNEALRREGKPYPRTCAICGLGKCNLVPAPAFDERPFTNAEKDRISSISGVVAAFWDEANGALTIGQFRAKIRREFLKPPSVADKLQDVLNALPKLSPHLMPIANAVDELNRLTKMFGLRPLSELQQVAHGRSGHDGINRWVILWGPSGYLDTPWRCHVGRKSPDDAKFAGQYVRHDCELFTDDGEDATHFSELPDEVARG